jgi:hypothetical protein
MQNVALQKKSASGYTQIYPQELLKTRTAKNSQQPITDLQGRPFGAHRRTLPARAGRVH